MKILLAALSLGLAVSQAHAISRYQTMRMTCDQVQAALDEEGAAILRWRSTTGINLPIYGRYVSDSGFCSFDEFATSRVCRPETTVLAMSRNASASSRMSLVVAHF